jgi:hypothetical protein
MEDEIKNNIIKSNNWLREKKRLNVAFQMVLGDSEMNRKISFSFSS